MRGLLKFISKRRKYPRTIDDVTERYKSITNELRERLSYAPLKKRKRENHFQKIKWLETDLDHMSIYAGSAPDFFTDERMSEIEGLLAEAHEYLNLTSIICGNIYNCFVKIHTFESFKEGVRVYRNFYESEKALREAYERSVA